MEWKGKRRQQNHQNHQTANQESNPAIDRHIDVLRVPVDSLAQSSREDRASRQFRDGGAGGGGGEGDEGRGALAVAGHAG